MAPFTTSRQRSFAVNFQDHASQQRGLRSPFRSVYKVAPLGGSGWSPSLEAGASGKRSAVKMPDPCFTPIFMSSHISVTIAAEDGLGRLRPYVPPAAASGLGPVSGLPYSQQTIRALRTAKDQAIRQGSMFVGPDQLLLGILAAAESSSAGSRGGSTSGAAAAGLLLTALGGGDADSVREWLNEQTGFVAPMVYGTGGRGGSGGTGGGGGFSVSSSRLQPSDVEFTGGAREVLRRAQAGAEAMGSRSVGTYHLLMVLMRSEEGQRDDSSRRSSGTAVAAAPEQEELQGEISGSNNFAMGKGATRLTGEGPYAASAASAVGPQPGSEEEEEAGTDGASSGGSGRGAGGSGASHRSRVVGSLPVLLRAVGANSASLYDKLLAAAEQETETDSVEGAAGAAYEVVVAHLRETYKRQAALPSLERDDAAFRIAISRGTDHRVEEEDPYE